MIASLSGQIQAIRDDALIVQVGGVGYHGYVASSFFDDAIHVGASIDLYTYMHVRESEMSLYGFRTLAEHDLFVILIGVSGIGPRTALAALSSFSPEMLRSAIIQGDAALLGRIPGVGRKTAERLMFDLRDKVGAAGTVWGTPGMREADADVISALTALGYSVAEARSALAAVPETVEALDERILEALRVLGTA